MIKFHYEGKITIECSIEPNEHVLPRAEIEKNFEMFPELLKQLIEENISEGQNSVELETVALGVTGLEGLEK